MATSRDPITCHVLDTTTGRPAANITVRLRNLSIPDVVFENKTNEDGRIMNWLNAQLPRENRGSLAAIEGGVTAALHSMIRSTACSEGNPVPGCPVGSSLWKLQFDTGAHYGLENTFFPIVELTFLVKEGEHFHVPLLLTPYSFTTYRGS